MNHGTRFVVLISLLTSHEISGLCLRVKFADVIGQGRVRQKQFAALAEKLGGAKTREGLEIMNEMRLVEVTARRCNICPIRRRVLLDERPCLLKPLNAAEQFRRHAHLCLENLNEPALA